MVPCFALLVVSSFFGGCYDVDEIDIKLKELKRELFKLRVVMKFVSDEYSLKEMKICEQVILNDFRKLSFEKVELSSRKREK